MITRGTFASSLRRMHANMELRRSEQRASNVRVRRGINVEMDEEANEEAWLRSLPNNPSTPGGYSVREPPAPYPPGYASNVGPSPPTPTGYSWTETEWDEV